MGQCYAANRTTVLSNTFFCYPAGIYLLKVINGKKSKTMSGICSKLTIKIPK